MDYFIYPQYCVTCVPGHPFTVAGILISCCLWCLTQWTWGPCTPSSRHFFLHWWVLKPFSEVSFLHPHIQTWLAFSLFHWSGRIPVHPLSRRRSHVKVQSHVICLRVIFHDRSCLVCSSVAFLGVSTWLYLPQILLLWVASPKQPHWGIFLPASCLSKLSHGISLVVSCPIHSSH